MAHVCARTLIARLRSSRQGPGGVRFGGLSLPSLTDSGDSYQRNFSNVRALLDRRSVLGLQQLCTVTPAGMQHDHWEACTRKGRSIPLLPCSDASRLLS